METAEQYVKARYTDARITGNVEYTVEAFGWFGKGRRVSDFCKTPEEAWESAKKRFTHPRNNGWNLELYKK